jgi:hypothetical protein
MQCVQCVRCVKRVGVTQISENLPQGIVTLNVGGVSYTTSFATLLCIRSTCISTTSSRPPSYRKPPPGSTSSTGMAR